MIHPWRNIKSKETLARIQSDRIRRRRTQKAYLNVEQQHVITIHYHLSYFNPKKRCKFKLKKLQLHFGVRRGTQPDLYLNFTVELISIKSKQI